MCKKILTLSAAILLLITQFGCAVIDKATVYRESSLTVHSNIPGADNGKMATDVSVWYATRLRGCPAGTVVSTEAYSQTRQYWDDFITQYGSTATDTFVGRYCVREDRPPPAAYNNWPERRVPRSYRR